MSYLGSLIPACPRLSVAQDFLGDVSVQDCELRRVAEVLAALAGAQDVRPGLAALERRRLERVAASSGQLR